MILNAATPVAIISGFAADSEQHEVLELENPVFDFGHNDLQPVAQRLCPAVTDAIEWLGAQGLKARMTGSGSSVFAKMPQAPHEAELVEAPKGLAGSSMQQFGCSSLWGWAT
jgi:4-diphosphocytidyl-2-C-methyl-D-erythritol kinase